MPCLAQASSCEKGAEKLLHTVKRGETLSGIAEQYDVSLATILKKNAKLQADHIGEGQILTICRQKTSSPSKSSAKICGSKLKLQHHEVKVGETISEISQRYAISESQLRKYNPKLGKKSSHLQIGQELLICTEPERIQNAKECNYETPLFRHEVIPGETVGRIAGRYGLRRKDLYRLNSKLRQSPHLIRPGQKILVCPDIAPRERIKVVHTIKSGENLGVIAQRYDLTLRELIDFQEGRLTDKDTLQIGQELVLWHDGPIVVGFGQDEDLLGVLTAGVQLPSGRYYMVKHPRLSWGTGKTIRMIQQAVVNYRKNISEAPKVHVGDISKKGGGPFPPHRSHQDGYDVDMAYVFKGELADEPRFRRADRKNLDVERTWALLKGFLDTEEVRYIFMDYELQKLVYEHAKAQGTSEDILDELFQYPRGRGRSHGIIRHWKGHADHFHVRFRK